MKLLYRITEFAELCDIDRQTVRKWIESGDLEYVEMNRRRYIPQRELVRLTGETVTT